MPGIFIVLAHPQFQHARVNRAMVEAARLVDGVVIHDLYERYPDFHIDIRCEKDVLSHVNTLVLQFPLQWYSCPSLLKEWMDMVLQRGWAYGNGGNALRGKNLLCAVSVGGSFQAYQADGLSRYPISEYLRAFEQMAIVCGMTFLEPFVFHNARQMNDTEISSHAQAYADLLRSFRGERYG